jgi:CRISPR-associated protein Csy3
MATTKLTTASVLAFERKLSNSDALMYSGNWANTASASDWQAIALTEKSVRGTISNRQKNAIQSDPAKLDAEVQKPNLQTVDVAALPFEHDTLKVAFSLRILGDLFLPSACNCQEYQTALQSTINGYIETAKFEELALRYAANLANGRFLWRNRVGAEGVQVRVKHIEDQKEVAQWVFNAHDFDLRSFESSSDDLVALGKVIQQGLLGDKFAFLKVEAFVRLGEGQEVFPSQELILDSSGKGKKSKTLYHVSGVAAMHSQKIGNALRTVDDWYSNAADFGPISAEPFGSVTSRGEAFRQPKDKMDFYTLLDKWVLKGEAPAMEQQHYVIANLIRGGVFGGKGE